MEIATHLKRWGNSLGVIIPMEEIKIRNLQEGEEIIITIEKRKKMKELFGSLKDWKINSQKIKDELRDEWE